MINKSDPKGLSPTTISIPRQPLGETRKEIAIVGGGMLGLTLARRLRQRGEKVTLIEAAPHLGGLASAWTVGDVVWDRHYHVTLLSDSYTLAILKELGLEQEMRWVITRTGCYSNTKLYSVSNTMEFLRFPPLNLIDKFRLGGTIFLGSRIKNWKKLEQITVSDWLTRWSGRQTFERFWLPLLKSKLGESYRETSAAFIWTTIQRLYAARSSGLKQEMFGYAPGGYAHVLDKFAERLKSDRVDIQLGCPVKQIRDENGKPVIEFENRESQRFDKVMVTASAPIAANICTALSNHERNQLANVRYLGIVCASLLMKRPLGGFYVTNITDAGFPFTGVIEMSALVDPKELDGNHLVYLPRYVTEGDPMYELADDEIEALFKKGLKRMYPDLKNSDILAFRVSRVRYVMPIPVMGYSETVLPFSTTQPGVFLVNSSQIVNGTLNVNETVALAERAVQTIAL